MVKVKQQFFKTAGGINFDQGLSLSANCQRVFVTGYTNGATACDFNGIETPLKSTEDLFVAGLDHNGNQKFFKTAGSININNENKISITSNCDRAFIAGQVSGNTATDFNGKIINNNTLFVAGLDNCGNQKFFSTAGGNINENQITQSVHDDMCIYITGLFGGTDFYDFNKTLIPTGSNIFVAGLNNCGHQKFFTPAGGPGDNYPLNLTVNDKAVFVTGYISSGAKDFNGTPITNYGQYDAFIAGLNKCGTQKFFKQAGVSGTGGVAFGLGVASDCHDVFVTGLIGQSGINFAGEPLNNTEPDNIFVAGLDSCGNQKFFLTAGSDSASGVDRGYSIVTNDCGVFVTGRIQGPNAFDFENKPLPLSGNNDIFVAGLTKCGKQKFFVTAGGSNPDQGISITSNAEGVFVTGIVAGSIATDFCGKSVTTLQGLNDIFVAKLDLCGRQQFFLTAGSNKSDIGHQIIVRDNEIYVTGLMGGTTGTDFKHCQVTTLKGNGDVFVARLDDLCGQKRSKRSTMPFGRR